MQHRDVYWENKNNQIICVVCYHVLTLIKIKTMLQKILDEFPEESFLKADGFDDAIIGVEEHSMRLIYSVSKVIEILREDMSWEDAVEHFEYNISGGHVGEKTPIWCRDNL